MIQKMQFLVLFILLSFQGKSQNLNGRYEGALVREGSGQLINFDFKENNGTYEIPELGLYGVPIEEIRLKNDTLFLSFYYGTIFCSVSEDERQITGISKGWLPKIKLHVKKSQERKRPYTSEEISFNNGQYRLAATLFHPEGCESTRSDYVILIHGSGSQDRSTPYYISLASQLAQNGIGVLFYDKRGCGKSEGDMEAATLKELAADANAAFDYLKGRSDLHISEIGFLGTSQGGWVAPIALSTNHECDFLILNVTPSVSVFEQDLHRVQYMMLSDGYEESAIDSAVKYTELYFKMAANACDATWDVLVEQSELLKEQAWHEYLNFPESRDDFEWWRKNNYDPAKDLSEINCRTLCVYGELDRLVPPAENAEKMRELLESAGIDFEIVILADVYHNLISSQGLNGLNWNWPYVYWQWRYQPREFAMRLVEFID